MDNVDIKYAYVSMSGFGSHSNLFNFIVIREISGILYMAETIMLRFFTSKNLFLLFHLISSCKCITTRRKKWLQDLEGFILFAAFLSRAILLARCSAAHLVQFNRSIRHGIFGGHPKDVNFLAIHRIPENRRAPRMHWRLSESLSSYTFTHFFPSDLERVQGIVDFDRMKAGILRLSSGHEPIAN